MKRSKHIAAWGLMILIAAAASFSAAPGDDQQDTDRFFKAKELVFKRDWSGARTGFESYLKDFPVGRMRDEALYWLAQSLDQLSRGTKDLEAVIRLKKAAVEHLRTLVETYPASLWKEDAAAYRVEIALTLVLLGEEGYKSVVGDALRDPTPGGRSVKLSALNTLADLGPRVAVPILRRALAEEPDAEVRRRAVRLLARFPSDDALPLLGEVARKDKDEKVRSEAASLVRLFEQRLTPVSLRYFIFGSRLLDEGLFAALPEKDVKEFALDRSPLGAAQELLGKARRSLGGEISSLTSSADGTMPFPLDFSLDSQTSHRAGDYQVWINQRTMVLSADRISGEIEFRNLLTGEVFTRPFRVEPSRDKLLVARSGANLSLLFFQFVKGRPAEEGSVGEEAGLVLRPPAGLGLFKEASRITLTHGVGVHTEKTDYALGDFDKDLIDLEMAKADIPAGAGTRAGAVWTLVGDLFYFKKQDKLVGFGAFLLDPGRRVVAEGLIEVPAGEPAGFKVLCGKAAGQAGRVAADLETRRTRPIYPTLFTNHLGWAVRTTSGSMDPTSKANMTDFGLARADRAFGGRDWVLIGQLLSLHKERKFVARQAALIASDGTILCGAELMVPADDPEAATVVKKAP